MTAAATITHRKAYRFRGLLSISVVGTAALTTLLATEPPVYASRADLAAFLDRTDKMAEFTGSARADIVIRTADDEIDQAVLIVDADTKQQFLAFKSSGWRVLAPLDWKPAVAIRVKDGTPEPISCDEPLAGGDLRPMDFFAYWKTDYTTAFVSDTNRTEKVITLYAPDEIPYILFVIAFDKAKLVPLNAKYYKDAMNNLVRLRKDSDHVMVGSRPRPRRIEITDYTENRTTTFDLSWRTLESVTPELMKRESFGSAEVSWPAGASD